MTPQAPSHKAHAGHLVLAAARCSQSTHASATTAVALNLSRKWPGRHFTGDVHSKPNIGMGRGQQAYFPTRNNQRLCPSLRAPCSSSFLANVLVRRSGSISLTAPSANDLWHLERADVAADAVALTAASRCRLKRLDTQVDWMAHSACCACAARMVRERAQHGVHKVESHRSFGSGRAGSSALTGSSKNGGNPRCVAAIPLLPITPYEGPFQM